MTQSDERAYTTKQWFWAVNLIAVLGTVGFLLPPALSSPVQTLLMFPFALVVALLVCWIFVAAPLAYAMRKRASWTRAALWGTGMAAAIALMAFGFAQSRRWRVQTDPNYSYQLGGGDYVRDVDGVLTHYGWWHVVQNNVLFVALGFAVALIVRAVLGPGRNVP